MSLANDPYLAFIESWFDKQPNETIDAAMERRAMQPNAVFAWLKPDPRDQHDPGDEDVLR